MLFFNLLPHQLLRVSTVKNSTASNQKFPSDDNAEPAPLREEIVALAEEGAGTY